MSFALSPKKKDAERLMERLICLTCTRVRTSTQRRGIEKITGNDCQSRRGEGKRVIGGKYAHRS